MGSSGMDWKQKASVLWYWENLLPIGANVSKNPRTMTAAPQANAKFAGLEATRHESMHSYCGTFSSTSEMGYSSSKSSVSVSTDSSPKTKDSIGLNFAPDKKTGKKTDLGKVIMPGPSSVIAVSSGERVLSLKLGKRTYFEDVCGGQSVKSLPSDMSALRRRQGRLQRRRNHTVRLKDASLISLLLKSTIGSTESVNLILRLPRNSDFVGSVAGSMD